MNNDTMTPEDIAKAENYPSLGPAYYAAWRVCKRAMVAFEAEHMKPLVEEFAKQVQDVLWDSVRDSLWSDVEMNLQGQMWDLVDRTVKALLTGERWALEKYALGSRYDCAAIRAAVASHIPKELQDLRIADLEAVVAQQKETIEFLRR